MILDCRLIRSSIKHFEDDAYNEYVADGSTVDTETRRTVVAAAAAAHGVGVRANAVGVGDVHQALVGSLVFSFLKQYSDTRTPTPVWIC